MILFLWEMKLLLRLIKINTEEYKDSKDHDQLSRIKIPMSFLGNQML